MNSTLALLLLPLALGFAGALAISWKEREPRLAAGALLLPALALRHWLSLTPLASSVEELVSTPYGSALGLEFAINTLAALAVIFLGRSLRELNRAERVQWDSMEGVRTLGEILATRRGALEDGLRDLLELGRQRFGLEFAVHARVEGEHYSVVAVQAPEDTPLKAGDAFELSETLCQRTVKNSGVLAIEQLSSVHWQAPTGSAQLGFEAYLGAPIVADAKVVGTLYFASQKTRAKRFSGVEKQLLLLMADWVGSQIEREQLAVASALPGSEPEAIPDIGGGRLILRRNDALDRRSVDVNSAITQLEPDLRSAMASARKFSLSLDPHYPAARLHRHEFDRVLWSLFWHALDASDPGSALHLSTAATEGPPEPDPGAARFILVSIAGDGLGLDAAGLARLFEDGPSAAPIASASGRLSLPRAQRLLQSQGGDLSVHSDLGGGTTLTAYLPFSDSQPGDSTAGA